MNSSLALKQHFPIFKTQEETLGKRFTFLDSAASSQRPNCVINAVSDFYSKYNANIKRSVYPIAEQATQAYEDARQSVAQLINAADKNEIIFTKGATEGINLVAYAWGLHNLQPGDEILVTQAEHHANLIPWQQIAKVTGAKLTFIPINPKTHLAEIESVNITSRTKLIAITFSSNILGNIWHKQHIATILEKAGKVGAVTLIDGAQAPAHYLVDVQKLDIDFFIISGHKMFGPTGIGAVYAHKRIWAAMQPYQTGGGMVHSVQFEQATWAKVPQKFEAGTPPIAQAIGLGAAANFIMKNINHVDRKEHEAALCKTAIEGMLTIDGMNIVGNVDMLQQEGHLICFSVDDIHPHDLAGYLGSHGVALRAGHHCVQPLVTMLGFDALVRISFAVYNTQEDVALFLTELKNAVNFFKKHSR